MIIAVDFDGTIVEHKFPEIGKTKLFAFETLKELQKQGHHLILWTYRSGQKLKNAVEFCKKNGIEFHAINANYPGEVFNENNISRKIYADVYIDDRNIGGFPGWSKIWEILDRSDTELKSQIAEKEVTKVDYSEKIKNIFKKKNK